MRCVPKGLRIVILSPEKWHGTRNRYKANRRISLPGACLRSLGFNNLSERAGFKVRVRVKVFLQGHLIEARGCPPVGDP